MEYEDLIYRERPVSPRHHMETAHRAKQFAPFAALTGLEQSVRSKEICYLPRAVLSEEAKEEIDRTLQRLQKMGRPGPKVTVTYFQSRGEAYRDGLVQKVTGEVAFFDPTLYLRVDEVEVKVKDILGIELK